MIGIFFGKSWYYLDMIWLYMLVGFVLSGFVICFFNVLLFGDDVVKLFGFFVEWYCFFIIMLVVFFSGVVVSVVGFIGFVGFVVLYIFCLIIGNDYKYLLLLFVFGGVLLVGFVDIVVRSWFGFIEFFVGILFVMIGVLFFLFLF